MCATASSNPNMYLENGAAWNFACAVQVQADIVSSKGEKWAHWSLWEWKAKCRPNFGKFEATFALRFHWEKLHFGPVWMKSMGMVHQQVFEFGILSETESISIIIHHLQNFDGISSVAATRLEMRQRRFRNKRRRGFHPIGQTCNWHHCRWHALPVVFRSAQGWMAKPSAKVHVGKTVTMDWFAQQSWVMSHVINNPPCISAHYKLYFIQSHWLVQGSRFWFWFLVQQQHHARQKQSADTANFQNCVQAWKPSCDRIYPSLYNTTYLELI